MKQTDEEHEAEEKLKFGEDEVLLGSLAWDDVSGKNLDVHKVAAARKKEIAYIEGKGVWKKMSRKEAIRKGLKVLQVRWIDINKGDEEREDYRSRLVAKEFNDGAQEGLFAATPPLEALRMLVSEAATIDPKLRGVKCK